MLRLLSLQLLCSWAVEVFQSLHDSGVVRSLQVLLKCSACVFFKLGLSAHMYTHKRAHTHNTQEYYCYHDFSGLKPHLKGDYDYDQDSKRSVDYSGKFKVRMLYLP